MPARQPSGAECKASAGRAQAGGRVEVDLSSAPAGLDCLQLCQDLLVAKPDLGSVVQVGIPIHLGLLV